MLLTMLLFALGNIPLLSWIKSSTSDGTDDSTYSMHSSPRYGSFSRDRSEGDRIDDSSQGPVARDLNWFERLDVSTLRHVFRRAAV